MDFCAYQGDFQIFFEAALRCAGAFAVAVSEVVANAFAICSLHGAFTQWAVMCQISARIRVDIAMAFAVRVHLRASPR